MTSITSTSHPIVDGKLASMGVPDREEARRIVAGAPLRGQASPARDGGGPPPPWRVLAFAPHRPLFLLGVMQIVLTMLWWTIDLAGRYAGWYAPVAWAVPPPWGHAFLMTYALFPLFIFGFAMTAVPNWTGRPVPRASWLGAAALLALGIVLLYAGLALGSGIFGAGIALLLAGWGVAWTALARNIVADRLRDRYALGLVVLLGIGWLGAAAFGGYLLTGDPLYSEISRRGGIWLFLLPLFLLVGHRLVPFFSSRIIQGYAIYRPQWSLPFLATASAAHFALEMLGLWQWTWTADAPMAAWTGYLAWRWGLAQSFRAKLLAMLHLSHAALAVALLLYAVESLASLLGGTGLLGLAPLHVLVIGFFAATAVAMVSRVSLGHSGRALEADTLTWRVFLGILAIAALRLAADLPFVPGPLRAMLLVAAAPAWLAVLVPWAARYAPLYLRPRADGRPG